jgi:hypothetical protein
MRLVRRPAIVSLTSLSVVAILLTLMSRAPAAQAIPSEFGAAGAPYADPAYCNALPALVKNFQNTILPKQARDLADQRARLSESEAGRAEAAEEFNQAVRDSIKTLATDQLSTAKALRARVNAMKASNMSKEARRNWLERIKTIEEAGETIKQGMGRAEFVETMQKNQTDLVSFMKFVEDSGAADAALKGLADTLAPGVGGLVVSGIKVGLDVVYAGLKGRFTAQEAAQWRENVAKLEQAHSELKDKVENYRQDLTGGVCGPKVAQQVQNSPQPIASTEMARTAPTAAPPPAPIEIPRVPSGPSMGKILGWTTLLGGAVVGGVYVAGQAAALAEEYSYTAPTTTTTTTTSTGSSTANYTYGNWNCNGGAQCTQVYGGQPTGSVGPFCIASACATWRQGETARTCTSQPLYTMRGFPPAGQACANQ